MVIHEPAFFPYAGTYKGFAEHDKLFAQIGKFYDFSRFKIVDLYAVGNVVFAILKSGLAGFQKEI